MFYNNDKEKACIFSQNIYNRNIYFYREVSFLFLLIQSLLQFFAACSPVYSLRDQ